MQQSFPHEAIKFNTYYYDFAKKLIGEAFNLTGFVEISEKKFTRERKHKLNNLNPSVEGVK